MARGLARSGGTASAEKSAMRTAIDTSVLIAIAKGEADGEDWVNLLGVCRQEGDLLLSDVAAAEYFALVLDETKFERTLRDLGIRFEPIQLPAALAAGAAFRSYRIRGGPRTHLIPDFLIATHALKQADRIAAKDRGYLRAFFPTLSVLAPE